MTSIPKSDGKSEVIERFGNTEDIIKVLLDSDKDENWQRQTVEVAKLFTKNRAGMRKLCDYVLKHIKYKIDPSGVQWLKSPSRSFEDGFADCKSLTLFITSVLRNMNLRYRIKFVGYGSEKSVSHVYSEVWLSGNWVVLDTVWQLPKYGGAFGTEKPYSSIKIYERKDR
jgi:hypothetical protein